LFIGRQARERTETSKRIKSKYGRPFCTFYRVGRGGYTTKKKEKRLQAERKRMHHTWWCPFLQLSL